MLLEGILYAMVSLSANFLAFKPERLIFRSLHQFIHNLYYYVVNDSSHLPKLSRDRNHHNG